MINFDKHGSDKDTIHTYGEFYEDCLQGAHRILEVGIQYGGSIKAMMELLPDAKFVGIDIEDIHGIDHPNFNFHHGGFEKVWPEIEGEFDVIIDDGSHELSDQLSFLLLARPHVTPGGLMIVEDIQYPDKELPELIAACPAGWKVKVHDWRTTRYDDVIVAFHYC